MRWVPVLLACAALMLCGCSRQIEVQSDTSWTGNLNGGSVEGRGYQTYTLKFENNVSCYVFQKQTEAGFLRVKAKKGQADEPSTTAAYGVVSGCAH